MPVSKKRKNRGKGKGAKEQARRRKEHNAKVRERLRYAPPDMNALAATVVIQKFLADAERRTESTPEAKS